MAAAAKQGQDGALTDAAEGGRVHHVGWESGLEDVEERIVFGISDETGYHVGLADGERGGADAGLVHDLPDGARAALGTAVEDSLEVALEDPAHKPVAGSAAVGQADDGHGEPISVFDSITLDCNHWTPHALRHV